MAGVIQHFSTTARMFLQLPAHEQRSFAQRRQGQEAVALGYLGILESSGHLFAVMANDLHCVTAYIAINSMAGVDPGPIFISKN